MAIKLIDGIDGRKMSKTFDNCVYLEDSPEDMYGKLLRIPDTLIALYFECCTDVPMDEVKKIEKDVSGGKVNPKEHKMRLAREIVTLYHSAAAAKKAEENFQHVFSDKGVPDEMPEVEVKKGTSLIDVMVDNKLVASKSEARRLIEQGGVKLNDETVQSVDAKAEKGVLKVGKRKFVKLI